MEKKVEVLSRFVLVWGFLVVGFVWFGFCCCWLVGIALLFLNFVCSFVFVCVLLLVLFCFSRSKLLLLTAVEILIKGLLNRNAITGP